MEFKNFTPHPVNVFVGNELIMSIPTEVDAEGERIQVRVSEHNESLRSIGKIPVVRKSYGDVIGLPAPQEDVALIVSVVVLSALQGKRDDVFCPDTGPESAVRDEKGQIIGVRRLQI